MDILGPVTRVKKKAWPHRRPWGGGDLLERRGHVRERLENLQTTAVQANQDPRAKILRLWAILNPEASTSQDEEITSKPPFLFFDVEYSHGSIQCIKGVASGKKDTTGYEPFEPPPLLSTAQQRLPTRRTACLSSQVNLSEHNSLHGHTRYTFVHATPQNLGSTKPA